MDKLKHTIPTKDTLCQIKVAEQKFGDLLKQEEVWWAQRAKAHWLQHGDLNTKFFHYKASQRKRKNSIYSIQDADGNIWKDSIHIHSTFLTYFQNIFNSTIQNINPDIFNVVRSRISNTNFEFLNKEFSALEVSEATKSLKGNFAPGPDGLSALFYHQYWDIIGLDILNYTLNILNNKGNMTEINHTYISLIPKTNNPKNPSDFRPISLCNVILKTITKTVANRIKKVLPNIIHENQSVFLPGRLITDNSLIVFETLNYIKKPRKKDNGFVGIKLDIAKAYDSLEWDFIESTLKAMGFPNNIIHVIMHCIRSVSFSILLNGQPTDPFYPNRGL